jgi:hypothetical protein
VTLSPLSSSPSLRGRGRNRKRGFAPLRHPTKGVGRVNTGSFKKVEGSKEMSEQQWFKHADKLKRQFDKINAEVQKAIVSGKSGAILHAMHRVEKEVPELLGKLEYSSPPKGGEWEESWQYFIEGLKGYLLACRYYFKGILEEDESAIKNAIGHMEEAGKLLKKARKIVEG